MKSFTRGALALVAAMSAPAMVAAQAKPVVAVLYFDNNSIGKDARDYDGIGKGMADLLITDMASASNVTVVEREKIQALLTEQNLTKEKTIDQATAIKLGKIVGAQYMITGGFMSDGRGSYVLTGRAINVQTGVITNPVRLNSKGDDVLGLMSQMSEKVRSEMKLSALQVGDAGAAKPTAEPAAAPVAAESKTAMKPADTKPAATKAPAKAVKMDMRTAMLYSKALEAEDAGNKRQAVDLFNQVVAKFPTFQPAKEHAKKNSA